MKNFKLGPITSFRKMPVNYDSFTPLQKRICDEEFHKRTSDKTKKHRDLFYYAEIIYSDLEYEGITMDENMRFIDKANVVHKDKYDYSLVKYINSKTHIFIKCPIHGVFEQRPTNHLQGQGCPKCSSKNKQNKDESITNYTAYVKEEIEEIYEEEEDESLYSDEFKDFLKIIENK